MELTMRQVAGFLRVVGKAQLVEFYTSVLSYGSVHGVELRSLDEFLALASEDKTKEPKDFDQNADSFLEAQALKSLAERQRANVK